MNFKNSEFLMLFVAFLIGYFFKDLTGVNLVEGNGRRRSRQENSLGEEDEVAANSLLQQVNPNPDEMDWTDTRKCPWGDGCMEVVTWGDRKNCIRVGFDKGAFLESCNPEFGTCSNLDENGHCI